MTHLDPCATRAQWPIIFHLLLLFLFGLTHGSENERRNEERRLDYDFYNIDKTKPVTVTITSLFQPIKEERPSDPTEDFIDSLMVQADPAPVEQDDLTQEKSIAVDLSFEHKKIVFDAFPGPSELIKLLEKNSDQENDFDEFLKRSSTFWYGEEREEEDNDRRRGSRGLKKGKKGFKSVMNLLKYSENGGDEFICGSITTEDQVVDISRFSNGTTALEVTDLKDFPGDDDHEPPNMYDVANSVLGDEENLRLRRLAVPHNLKKISNIEKTGLSRGLSVDPDHKAEIDVLVLYSRRAMCTQAYLASDCEDNEINHSQIHARIQLAINESNTAYLLSNVYINLKLKHMELAPDFNDQISYGSILSAFKNKDDGLLDQVHTLRETHKADLAVLVVENSQYCGLGYMYNGNKDFGFSVTSRKCMTGYYSFVHELSHNMGCNHNREVSSKSFPYAHAHLDPDQGFRTVMGYNCKRGCPRVNRFSNPDVQYMGKPTGSSQENNAYQINSVASAVADWYHDTSVQIIPETQVTNPPTQAPTKPISNGNGCEAAADAFGVKNIYATDQFQMANNWVGKFDSNFDANFDLADDSRNKHNWLDNTPTNANFDVADERLKFNTYGRINVQDPKEVLFTGPTTMAISKAKDQDGFEDIELTTYVKWIKDGTYAYDPSVVLSARANVPVDQMDGCNAQSYIARISRKDGKVHFQKSYYKKGFQEIGSQSISITPDDFDFEIDKYIGMKFVVYTQNSLEVKLELYADQTDGENGGEWKLIHEYVDSPGKWKAQRGWHYSTFARSSCSRENGEPFLGHRKFVMISVDGTHDTQASFKKISVRNVAINEQQVELDVNCFGSQSQTTDQPTPYHTFPPTRSPTKNPTSKPTRSPTINPTSKPIRSPTKNPTHNPPNLPKLNLVFSTETETNSKAASNTQIVPIASDSCDDFGLSTKYKSDPTMAMNDWVGTFEGPADSLTSVLTALTPIQSERMYREYGDIVIGNDKAIFTSSASMFIQKEFSTSGYKNLEYTAYGHHTGGGTAYMTMTALLHNPMSYHCNGASYSVTINSSTGEAIFDKIYWKSSYRVVKAMPRKAQIFGLENGVPPNAWIGIKFVVKVINEGLVTLELYLDLTRGQNGGAWQLVHQTYDSINTWNADTNSLWYRYYVKSSCNSYGKVITGPSPYCALQTHGDKTKQVYWKNVSIRNILNENSEAASCPHVWKD